MAAPTDGPRVPPEAVLDCLTRTELGSALWRAAHFEALSEIQAKRIAELESQTAAPTVPPDNGWAVPEGEGQTGG
jgi:hypothetical protein